MNPEMKRLGWTTVCCLCGAYTICWNNPAPLRNGDEGNCCEACNRLVIAARRKISSLTKSEGVVYAQMLRDLPIKRLNDVLFPS